MLMIYSSLVHREPHFLGISKHLEPIKLILIPIIWLTFTDVCRCSHTHTQDDLWIFNSLFIRWYFRIFTHLNGHTDTHTHHKSPYSLWWASMKQICESTRDDRATPPPPGDSPELHAVCCSLPSTQWALCVSQCVDQSASVSPASEPQDEMRGEVLFCAVPIGSLLT